MAAAGRRRRRRAGNTGLTLIELLISLALTSVLLVPAASLLLQSYSNETTYEQQNSAQQNARHALDLVADDMRGAIPVTSIVMVNGLQTTLPTDTVRGVTAVGGTPANIVYTSPLYFDIYDDNGNERRVRYWLEGTNLRREIVTYVDDTTTPGTPASATSGVVMARNVLTFTAERQPVTVGNVPNYNVVRLTIASGQGTGADATYVKLTADATLRNNLVSDSSS